MLEFGDFVGCQFPDAAVGLVVRSNLCSNFSLVTEMGWGSVIWAFYDATEPIKDQWQRPMRPTRDLDEQEAVAGLTAMSASAAMSTGLGLLPVTKPF